jgi:hypothetical protein
VTSSEPARRVGGVGCPVAKVGEPVEYVKVLFD